MNSTLHSATAEYIEAVRSALADQPASEVEEVIDDITEHLEQVTAELGESPSREDLEARLGTPQHYAYELRTAAGLVEPEQTVTKPRGRRRAAVNRFVVTWLLRLGVAIAIVGTLYQLGNRWTGPDEAAGTYLIGLLPVGAALLLWLAVHRSMDSVAALRRLPDAPRIEAGIAAVRLRPWGRAALEFLESLRPAWWLLRGWLVTQVLIFAADGDPVFPIDPSPVAIVVLIAAIIGSVWWGRNTVAGLPAGWPTRSSRAGNLALAAVAPAVVLLASPEASASVYDGPQVVYEEVPQADGFFHEDGTEIRNLFVYGPDGELIEGARIYDQAGRPVENIAPWKYRVRRDCVAEGGWFPGGIQGNVFPRPSVYDDRPGCGEPMQAAPYGGSLPAGLANPNAPKPEVNTEPDATAEPDAGTTELPTPVETEEPQVGDVPPSERGS